MTLRCVKIYEIDGCIEVCVKSQAHEGECQINLWWAVKIPELAVGIGTAIECQKTIRRVL